MKVEAAVVEATTKNSGRTQAQGRVGEGGERKSAEGRGERRGTNTCGEARAKAGAIAVFVLKQ